MVRLGGGGKLGCLVFVVEGERKGGGGGDGGLGHVLQ